MATVTEAFDLFDKWVCDGCEYHPLLISELQGAFAEARAEVERLRADRLAVAERAAREMQREAIYAIRDLGLSGGHPGVKAFSSSVRTLDTAAVARRAVDAEGGG